jgi:hypothetical protein
MSKLTIDDLVAAQQRKEATLQDIANSLRSVKKPTKKESATNALSNLVSVVVWGMKHLENLLFFLIRGVSFIICVLYANMFVAFMARPDCRALFERLGY